MVSINISLKWLKARLPKAIVGCFFFVALIIASASGQAPDLSEKAAPGVLDEITSGRSQDFIVLFDDTEVRNRASMMRKNLGAEQDTDDILSAKAEMHRALKQEVLSTLTTDEAETIEDYANFPMTFMKIKSLNGLRQLQRHSRVVKIFKNEEYHHFLAQSLPLIRQPDVEASGKVGTGTSVAVLDTGVDYTRAVFGSCSAPGLPASCKVIHAEDFTTSFGSPYDDGSLDDDGHGTNVAGIVLGVAPDTRIIALDIFVGSSAKASDIIAAINWCIANKTLFNIVAINMSLGGSTGFTTSCSGDVFATPVANARAAGILSAIASGNDGYTNKISSPACVPAAVSVGAVYDSNMGSIGWSKCTDMTTSANKVTCFSNSASYLTILAPGSEITAAGITMSGTSQASPHIAGAIAALRGQGAFPSYTADQTVSRMTSTGVALTDSRNGVTKPRINLLAAAQPVRHSISGIVTSLGLPLAGVSMTLSTGATTITDGAGRYSFKRLVDKSYTVTPVFPGSTFKPLSRTVTLSGANIFGQNFAVAHFIAGKVSSGGLPLAGVTMTLSSGQTTITSSTGYYKFAGLLNGTYSVTPALRGYVFTPLSRTVTVNNADVTAQTFAGTLN